jgi:hypothetical protein
VVTPYLSRVDSAQRAAGTDARAVTTMIAASITQPRSPCSTQKKVTTGGPTTAITEKPRPAKPWY